jgi:DNA-binding LytR/AlgR family response regulator
MVIFISASYNHRHRCNNLEYVKPLKNFANDTALQFTIRELQAQISNPRFWVGLVAIVFVLAMVGPFYTFSSLTFSNRLVYWAIISYVNYLVGFCVSLYVGHLFYAKGMPELASRMISGFVSGIPIAFIVWTVNKYIYGFDMSGGFGFWKLLGYCAIIAMVISLMFYLFSLETRKNEPFSSQPTLGKISKNQAFLQRLPAHLGRDILALEAQDHYVSVTTKNGSALVLIRLVDAIAELDGLEGLRIHRSHWVAAEAISKTKRENGKLLVELTNGTALPVSRTYAKNLKDNFAV